MADVFISYKREDRRSVERLAQALRGLGLEVWFDASLNAGEAFSDEIDREAHAAKAILVCWSPTARESQWVKSEALIGFEQRKLAACYVAGPDGFYPPTPFNSIHAEDLRAWVVAPSNTHAGYKSILRRVGALCGRADIENFGALDVLASATTLRDWIERHQSSPLFTAVDELVRARDAEEADRARLETEARERNAREKLEQRERQQTARLPREVQDSPSWMIMSAMGLVAFIVVLVWHPWRSISAPVAPAATFEATEGSTGTASTVESRSPSVLAAPNNFELACSLLREATPASLRMRYGAENLSAERVPIGEGNAYSATVLFSSDPARRLEFVWDDTGALWQVRALGNSSVWIGPNGLRLGQELQDVERANAAPFTLTGWGWDYGGRAYNWGAGVLSRESCRILVDFAARAPAPVGDSDFASNSIAVRNADPVVVGLMLAPR